MPARAAPVKWEWENDDGTDYNAFDKSVAAELETHYKEMNGRGVLKKTIASRNYSFDFDAMTQLNVDTGSKRRIRRTGPLLPPAATTSAPALPPPATTFVTVTWEWMSDKGWKPCDAKSIATLEAAYTSATAASHTTTLEIAGTKYVADFVTMEQTNQSSKTARALRRLENGVAVASKLAPAVGSKTAASTSADDSADAPAAKKTKLETSSAAHTSSGHTSSGTTKMVKKGKGVVDVNSGMQDKAHIYESADGKVYQATLNQTNVAENNNKFYIVQLLESDKGGEYWVWTRWGRVGVVGQSNLDHAFSLPAAIAQFNKKFREKTSNDFNNLASFTKVPGKYQLMEMDFGDNADDGSGATDLAADTSAYPAATIDPSIQDIMRMIGNKGDMEKAMKELEIDTAKMPLGKISKKQIKEAFEYLKKIEAEIKSGHPSSSTLEHCTSMFYTLVPHDFGFSKPPIIRDETILKRKMELLDVLADLEVATKLLDETKKSGKNPLDAAYASLKCVLTPVPKDSPTFKRIQAYAANTHGSTHSGYSLEVLAVFEVDREGEAKRYEAYSSSIPNKQLLWHGSRTTNYMGILSQGLRIAPPEAPCTGYMFGKGVYFADSCSKSANYCHTSASSPEGLMLLCEAALGTTKDYCHAFYMDKPQPGTHSTKGVGKNEPKESEAQYVDGVKWPMGHMAPTPGDPKTTLLYHEYIVYDVAQCKMNYLLKVRFKYKK